MISGLFRISSWLILAGAVLIAVVDATRSVAANSLQLTSFGATLEAYWPAAAEWFSTLKANLTGLIIGGWPLSNVIDYVNAMPVALLAAALFLLIYALASRNREKRHF